jgi:hypothetical protein
MSERMQLVDDLFSTQRNLEIGISLSIDNANSQRKLLREMIEELEREEM